jgi:hypothetical protein
MTIADMCLLAAVILTILSIMPAKFSGGGNSTTPTRGILGSTRLVCGRGHRVLI